ncbi:MULTISPECIES: flagellar hook-associated protein FlgK [Crateriforma]|uniref:Flagellar hook-associated protein 1 n=1 Tax=Crateriforma conspicua TaxID=2527996 RepID=A0A5C6FXA8_9PLAN|nr:MULTISPECIES: flagellar hook-associated protein FlgK [Crateriforma]TWU65958.1 Flagellar hook-associated protein 1 [Crateriforma conspicua]
MSLFGTIQQSNGALQAAQIGLQVVGNNIANSNTEGYIRQRLEQTPAGAFRQGGLIKGQGVRPTGITQVVDKALAEQMFNAGTALAGAESLGQAYSQLEEIASELDNNGINFQLSEFNNALHELTTQPADSALREFVILQGQSLASKLNNTREKVLDRQAGVNTELDDISNQINRLTNRIAELNVEIATIEGGGLIGSDATGLRDERYQALEELATYVNINFQEQTSGNVNVFVGGDYLVTNGIARDVYTAYSENESRPEVRIIETDAPLQATGGKLGAALQARDSIFGEFVGDLDSMASGLIRTINQIHTQGQGRKGYTDLTSDSASEPGVPLESAGLPFTPENGTFDMALVDADGKVISNHRITVRVLGQVGDSTMQSVAQQIDDIDGLSATITNEGRLKIRSDNPPTEFTFGEDTSGFLAAAGLNTFFTGTHAGDIAVNDVLAQDADLLAVSFGGIGEDTEALYEMTDLVDRPLDVLDGRTVRGVYEHSIASLGQEVSLHQSSTQGLSDFHATLQSKHLAITGVNIDEESIKMIMYQRAFQASSRVISTASEMLDLLVNL